MISIDRIVCPLDFSVVSRSAPEQAVALARPCGASITALHVEPRASSVPAARDRAAAAVGVGERIQTRAGSSGRSFELLTAAIEPAVRARVKVDRVVASGNVVERILGHADTPAGDMLIVGTRGARGFKRLVKGSVAEKIVRRATCPVLTISRRATETASPPQRRFRRVLCAVDFSEASLRALEYALTLADGPDCELTLLHVLEPSAYGLNTKEMAQHPERDPATILQTQARLEGLLPDDAEVRCASQVEVRAGKAQDRIIEVAEERGAHVVVIGIHGRERFFLGSVANEIVRRAPCPVLSVHDVTPAAAPSESESTLEMPEAAPSTM